MKPAEIFKTQLNKLDFKQIFEKFIEDKATVGRDGVRVEKFKLNIDSEIEIALRKIKAGTYEFTSYKEKLISKGANNKPRQISIPTVRDKLVLKFLSELLAQVYVEHVSKPPHKLVKKIHATSSLAPPSTNYLRLDIQSYFPSINHQILMRILRRKIRQKELLHLIENAISTPTGKPKNEKSISTVGVPQGLSISNILSSIYLEDIDLLYSKPTGVEYNRFVDDVLVMADYEIAKELSVAIPKDMDRKRKITCHRVGQGSKSVLVDISKGIDYLGYHFCGKVLEVRQSSYNKMFGNLIKLFTAMKYKPNRAPLIWRMNLRISGCVFQDRKIGWLFYFSQSENKQQLRQLDVFLQKHAKKTLSSDNCDKLKTFTRAYHEIRFNLLHSKYFPNFDFFDIEQKKKQIAFLLPRKKAKATDLDAMSEEEINKLFNKCITREINDLEKDMMEVFS